MLKSDLKPMKPDNTYIDEIVKKEKKVHKQKADLHIL